jgi:hypothetical protein
MQTSDPGQRDHLPQAQPFLGPLCRSIAGKTHVRANLVVITSVLTDQTEQVAFAEHNHVVQ